MTSLWIHGAIERAAQENRLAVHANFFADSFDVAEAEPDCPLIARIGRAAERDIQPVTCMGEFTPRQCRFA
jgi:hypothetical protein